MPLIYRILLTIVIATPLSALYYAYAQGGELGFTLDAFTACAFAGTALLCVLLGSGPSPAPTSKPAASKTKAGKAGKREQGVVKWFNGGKGYGFIKRSSGEEIFVHFRAVQKNSRRLAPGLDVEFEVIEGEKGPEASNVSVLS